MNIAKKIHRFSRAKRRLLYLAVALVFVSSALMVAWPSKAKALTAGPNNGGTGGNDSSIGGTAWTNPGNATGASDTVYATVAMSAFGFSQYLSVTGLGFSIPTTANINGITATVTGHCSATTSCADNFVEIEVANVASGTDHSATGWGTTDSTATYGGSADAWGLTLTGTDVNNTGFGLAFSVQNAALASRTMSVDSITMTITYTVPNALPAAPTLNTPSNAGTVTSNTPQFQLRTTDAEGDYLRYKIQLCQDSSCVTVLQTWDQTASQTGWSGQDQQTSTAYTGSSTITSSTMATFTPSSALTPNVTYYWRGYAIDPGGSNTFGSASSIWSFIISNVPAAPTLITPSNGAGSTGNSPTFQLRTTDADNDYLEYKIQLCQDAACVTVLQTWDQTASQTGWSGQDQQAGTAYTGNATLSSSTIANYSISSGLSLNTTYYWRAYAIDPGGSNTFSSASAIWSFTTANATVNIGGGVNILGGTTIQ